MSSDVYMLAIDKEEAGFFKEAFDLLLNGALSGDAACQFRVGYYFDIGIAAKRSAKKAIYWYKKSMANDFECRYKNMSAHNIAVICRERRRFKESERYFLKAIDLGLIGDHLEIALLHIDSSIRFAVTHLEILSKLDCRYGVEIYQQRIAKYLLHIISSSRLWQKRLLLKGRKIDPRSRKNKWPNKMSELDFALTLLVHGRLKQAKRKLKFIIEDHKNNQRIRDVALTVLVALK